MPIFTCNEVKALVPALEIFAVSNGYDITARNMTKTATNAALLVCGNLEKLEDATPTSAYVEMPPTNMNNCIMARKGCPITKNSAEFTINARVRLMTECSRLLDMNTNAIAANSNIAVIASMYIVISYNSRPHCRSSGRRT